MERGSPDALRATSAARLPHGRHHGRAAAHLHGRTGGHLAAAKPPDTPGRTHAGGSMDVDRNRHLLRAAWPR